MKKLFLPLVLIIFASCSKDSDENAPQLSFVIEDINQVASSQIIATNTSSNYDGDYIWEVTSASATTTYTTEKLNFDATRIGGYIVKLKSSNGELETQKSVAIFAPLTKVLDKITLKAIPKNYEALYFKIYKYTPFGNKTIVIYISQQQQNIAPSNASEIAWDIQNTSLEIELVDLRLGPAFEQLESYEIEFFNSNDESVTRFDPFANIFDETTDFIAGDISFTTTRNDCANCDQFEILANFSYEN